MKDHPSIFTGGSVRAILAGQKTQTRRVAAPANSTVDGSPAKRHWPHLLFEHAIVERRSIVSSDDLHLAVPYRHPEEKEPLDLENCSWSRVRPRREKGDRLWVKETFSLIEATGERLYRADPVYANCRSGDIGWGWTPSIFMPRRASRITLEIADVRVQRVQEISEDDALAEGCNPSEEVNFWHVLTDKGSYSYSDHDTEPVDGSIDKMGGKIVGHCRQQILPAKSARDAFQTLWDSINAAPKPVNGEDGKVASYVSYPWDGEAETKTHRGLPWRVVPNPWVWALTFKRVG